METKQKSGYLSISYYTLKSAFTILTATNQLFFHFVVNLSVACESLAALLVPAE